MHVIQKHKLTNILFGILLAGIVAVSVPQIASATSCGDTVDQESCAQLLTQAQNHCDSLSSGQDTCYISISNCSGQPASAYMNCLGGIANPTDTNGSGTSGTSGSGNSSSNCIADNQAICNSTTTDPGVNCDSTGKCTCTSKYCDIVGNYVNPAIKVLSWVVGVVAAISIIFSGIQYTMSGGDSKKTAEAKSRIVKTVLGLVAYAFLFGFLQFIVPGGLFNRGS